LYSLPEIINKADNTSEDKIWTLESLDAAMPSVTGDLKNMWPRKEESRQRRRRRHRR
jgi:hypothetical protein